eukprot:g22747.t1
MGNKEMAEELNRYFASDFMVEDIRSTPELQDSQGAEVSVVTITKEKVLGKLESLKGEIAEHLEVHGKIGLGQHGFVNGRSCLTNLLEFFAEALSKLDKGEPGDVIYLDFQKAFDKEAHRRLLNKIRAHGVRGK